jgi:hypothetical protein
LRYAGIANVGRAERSIDISDADCMLYEIEASVPRTYLADIIEKVMKPPPLIRPSVSKGAAPPEAINIMRQCWAEAAEMRPDFDDVHDLFKKLNHGR